MNFWETGKHGNVICVLKSEMSIGSEDLTKIGNTKNSNNIEYALFAVTEACAIYGRKILRVNQDCG